MRTKSTLRTRRRSALVCLSLSSWPSPGFAAAGSLVEASSGSMAAGSDANLGEQESRKGEVATRAQSGPPVPQGCGKSGLSGAATVTGPQEGRGERRERVGQMVRSSQGDNIRKSALRRCEHGAVLYESCSVLQSRSTDLLELSGQSEIGGALIWESVPLARRPPRPAPTRTRGWPHSLAGEHTLCVPRSPVQVPLTCVSSRSLPAPLHSTLPDDHDAPAPAQAAPQSTALAVQGPQIPPYGQRKGWKPKSQADFGDGGAYPECPVAQYPLELGRKKVSLRTTASGRGLVPARVLL